MLARVRSAALFGVDAVPVEVEVDVSPGLPAFTIPGSVYQIKKAHIDYQLDEPKI